MEQKKSRKPLIIIIVILVAIAAAAAGAMAYHNHQIEEMRNTGVTQLASSIDLKEYREAEQNGIQEIIDTYTEKINNAEDQDEVDKYTEAAIKEFSVFETDAELTAKEEAARKAAEEKKRKEEEKKRKAEEAAKKKAEEEAAAAAAAAAAAQQSSGGGGKKSGGSKKGCVGNDAKNFY